MSLLVLLLPLLLLGAMAPKAPSRPLLVPVRSGTENSSLTGPRLFAVMAAAAGAGAGASIVARVTTT